MTINKIEVIPLGISPSLYRVPEGNDFPRLRPGKQRYIPTRQDDGIKIPVKRSGALP